MEKFRFLEWEAYRDAKQLLLKVLDLVKTLPKEYRFEIGSQIIRSTLSIALNIAEGSGKTSDKELNRFLEIAIGSAHETLAAADILHDAKLISDDDFQDISKRIESISSQLGGFKKSIARR